MARGQFGVSCEVVRHLPSERDRVVLLAGVGADYVLKVSNSAELQVNNRFENEAINWAHKADPELPLAVPLPTVFGDLHGHVDGHFVRMFPRVHGEASIPGATLDISSIKAYGEVVARFSKSPRGFFHAGATRRLLWHTDSLPQVRPLTRHLADPAAQALAERCFERSEQNVVPHSRLLRAQVVHCDLTLDNVLLSEGQVSDIIDYRDLAHSTLLADVATALCSVGDLRRGPTCSARGVFSWMVTTE